MSGVLIIAASKGATRALSTNVTAASVGGNDYGYISGAVGSIVSATYSDGINTTRTVRQVYGDGGFDTNAVFSLDGNSVPNNDATFSYLLLDGVIFQRSAASYNGSDGAYSTWTWSYGAFVGGAGTHTLVVIV